MKAKFQQVEAGLVHLGNKHYSCTIFLLVEYKSYTLLAMKVADPQSNSLETVTFVLVFAASEIKDSGRSALCII